MASPLWPLLWVMLWMTSSEMRKVWCKTVRSRQARRQRKFVSVDQCNVLTALSIFYVPRSQPQLRVEPHDCAYNELHARPRLILHPCRFNEAGVLNPCGFPNTNSWSKWLLSNKKVEACAPPLAWASPLCPMWRPLATLAEFRRLMREPRIQYTAQLITSTAKF
jgi:hypothetical protein